MSMENGEKSEVLSLAEMGKPYRFTSENQPENRGRKPSLYKIASEECDISHEDFCKVCKYLLHRSKKELEEIIELPTTPIWMVNVARAIHKDSGKGNTYTLQWLVTRFWGNPQDSLKMEATSRVAHVNINVEDAETADLIEKVINRD